MTDALTRMLLVLISDLFPGAVLMTTVSVVPRALQQSKLSDHRGALNCAPTSTIVQMCVCLRMIAVFYMVKCIRNATHCCNINASCDVGQVRQINN